MQNLCLPFFDHLIVGLNTRFDIYDSMIYKMHAFVSSVIGMGKVEGNNKIEEISHECRDEYSLPQITLKNTQDEKDD